MGTPEGFASPFGPTTPSTYALASLGLAKLSREGLRRAKLVAPHAGDSSGWFPYPPCSAPGKAQRAAPHAGQARLVGRATYCYKVRFTEAQR
jgi:hypothetical protein